MQNINLIIKKNMSQFKLETLRELLQNQKIRPEGSDLIQEFRAWVDNKGEIHKVSRKVSDPSSEYKTIFLKLRSSLKDQTVQIEAYNCTLTRPDVQKIILHSVAQANKVLAKSSLK